MTALVKAIKIILKKAIDAGGTTLRDFHNSDGSEGYFKIKLNVYDKKNKPCPNCNSAIRLIVIGQRSTYYCVNCQT
jgi:formamidopyrimidine-DNA glycosylase